MKMMLSIWLLLSVLNLAGFSQAVFQASGNSTPNSSIYENDVLKTVANTLELVKNVNKNFRLGMDNMNLIINQLSSISSSSTTSPSTITSPSSTISPSTTRTTKYPIYLPSNCGDAMRLIGHQNGVYTIRVPGSKLEPFDVYCMSDPNGDGGAWTLIQRRLDGSVDFQKEWVDYVRGFGNTQGEFWIGLEKIHELTKSLQQELWIHMEDFEGVQRWAKYTSFYVGNATDSYDLKVLGSYSGNAGDSMRSHVGQKFSTKDNDNDGSTSSCAMTYTGAWWYNECGDSNLNGQYLRGAYSLNLFGQGIVWPCWRSPWYSLKYVHMAIRP